MCPALAPIFSERRPPFIVAATGAADQRAHDPGDLVDHVLRHLPLNIPNHAIDEVILIKRTIFAPIKKPFQ